MGAQQGLNTYKVRVAEGRGTGLEAFEVSAATEEEAVEKARKAAGTDELTVVLVKRARPKASFLKTMTALLAAFMQDPDAPAKRARARARAARRGTKRRSG